MARVVQRRSNPPILLIIFVFLFLIASTLAVMGFLRQGEATADLSKTKTSLRQANSENDKLKSQNSEMVFLITGKRGSSTGEATAAANSAYDNPAYKAAGGQRGGLAPELINLSSKVQSLELQLQKLKDKIQTAYDDLAKQKQAADKQINEHGKSIEKVAGEKKQLSEQLKQAQQNRTGDQEAAKSDLAGIREELEKEIKLRERQIEEMTLELSLRGKKNEVLEEQIRILKGDSGRGADMSQNQPDGKVVKIASGTDICYVNIGNKDGVKQGTTFAVYGQNTTMKKDDKKGSLKVLKVSNNFSECKITEQESDSPIVTGDLIANVVFDPIRSHTFVVIGLFDLRNTGRPNSHDAEEIKEVIERFGGKVTGDIDIHADYLVMGVVPNRPQKPSDEAPPSVVRAYEQQIKRYQEMIDAKKLAQTLNIPILNTNRFLLLTGYEPEKAPE